MGNKNSKTSSMSRASRVASSIGSKHYDLKIDEAFDSIVGSFEKTTGLTPKYEAEGGTMVEDLALQNVTARSRMVISYLMAQLVPWSRDEKGFMLVLGTANIAEGLRGYFTKYDTSAADINPIGGINKSDMK
jgi:NAD+ synthase (glutamine-hydrolysing)